MPSKRVLWLTWALCGLVAFHAVMWSVYGLMSRRGSESSRELVSDALFTLLLPVAFAIVAALIVSRQPRNTIGWLLIAPVALFLIGEPIEQFVQRLAPTSPSASPALLLIVWFYNWMWILLIFPMLYIMLLFPSGQPPGPRWRWVSHGMIVWASLFIMTIALVQPIGANTTPEIVLDNPVGLLTQDTAVRIASIWVLGLFVLFVLCVAALVVRYRGANVTERKQIQWLLYACVMFMLVFVLGNWIAESTSVAGFIWEVFFPLSVASLPVAIGIAVLRYRLYDIDVIIRKTLVYSASTASLGSLYLGSVLLLQVLLSPLTEGSSIAIAASTLAVAALFQPVRRRIQVSVDRRFYRQSYDAAQTLSSFGLMVRDEVDLERLTMAMVAVIDETMQPAHITVWITDTPSADETARDVRGLIRS